MEILDANVDWREGYVNDPRLEILVDEIPSRDEMRFEHRDGLWYAEKDGFATFFAWSGPENEGGYNGANYEITTVEGETVTLKGPWSSRAGVANKFGFGPCLGVRITERPEVLEQGYTFRSGAVTLEAAKQAVDIVGGCHLERRVKYDQEPYWIPVRHGGEASD